MVQKPLLLLIVIVWSTVFGSSLVWAEDYAYQGKVEGMVCTFCVYNVSKKIAALPSVDAQSVNVDLNTGHVDIKATAKIDKAAVSSVFSDSGFTLVEFKEVAYSNLSPVSFSSEPLIALRFSSTAIDQMDAVLDAIGTLAASRTSQLSISAPETAEIDILKPILAGRKSVIKVHFLPAKGNEVQLKLFSAVSANTGAE
ncbi:heavy metal-associated domain-containing protein [Dasania marina]|uniref:heavy-metal-associated domain-containing protein n=1 Tax=Dasania marina TaxID=471499 RepID=UPI0030D79A65|tara:strand:- start:7945 stop:8538 length:594 start_codon:yes stop_codon:yes gene_type:complete